MTHEHSNFVARIATVQNGLGLDERWKRPALSHPSTTGLYGRWWTGAFHLRVGM